MNYFLSYLGSLTGSIIVLFIVVALPMRIIYKVVKITPTFGDDPKNAAIVACVLTGVGVFVLDLLSNGFDLVFHLSLIIASLMWLGLYFTEINRNEKKQENKQGDKDKQNIREIKSKNELITLSSWMETPRKQKSTVRTAQPISNQRPQSLVVNKTLKIINSNSNLSTITKEKDQKSDKPYLGMLSKDEVTQILSQNNLLALDQSLKVDDLPKPRIHHYLFAHKYLPEKLSKSPQMMLSWLTGEKGVQHLVARWEMMRLSYNIEDKDYIEPVGMNRILLPLKDGYTLIVIRFPKPINPTEAFFSAILFNQQNNSYRYFTLELTFSNGNRNVYKTILGEWVNDNHINHGDGTLPSIEDFSSLIIERFA